jgi:hypothetical protein
MPAISITRPPKHLASREPIDSHELTMDKVVPCLVGHTIKEVERELILHTLAGNVPRFVELGAASVAS